MQLVERHIVSKTHQQWKACDQLCFLSKNLYNYALYIVRKHYEETGHFLRYRELDKMFKDQNQHDYRAMINNTAQQTLILLDRNLTAYFRALKSFKKDRKKFLGCPRPPQYKHKTKGRNITVFTYVQIRCKNGYITFPKKTQLLPLKTKIDFDQVQQVRIIPQNCCYVIEVVYNHQEKEYVDNGSYLAIDLGVNNLATCTTNLNNNPFIISGRPLKSVNQYYNKKRAKIQSQLQKNHNRKISRRLNKLTFKRNNKVKNYLHHTSKKIVSYCQQHNISNIIIGKNDGWKQNVNLSKKTNQNFVQIPFDTLIQQIEYKGKLQGIKVQQTTEAYTSRCSALDLEPIQKHDSYLGNRVKRGLFISSKKIKINADVNGSLNILRKVIGDKALSVQTLTNRGQVTWPTKTLSLRSVVKLHL